MQIDFDIENVDPGIEKLIILGMIADDKFLFEIYEATKPEYFKGDISATVAQWCREYFNEHGSAPKKSIWDILQIKKDTEVEDDEDRDFVATITEFLKNTVTNAELKSFNREYILRKAFSYLYLNSLQVRIEKAQKALNRNEPDKAAKILDNAAKEVFEEQPKPLELPDMDAFREMYNEDKESIMAFPDAMGEYLKPIRRGKMIAMLGPTKRGKSHWLLEWAYQAHWQGLKVIHFSLELSRNEMLALLATRWLNKEISEEGGGILKTYNVPVFDCLLNQIGNNTCDMDLYKGTHRSVVDAEGGIWDEWEDHSNHVVCTACRHHPDREVRANYIMSTWMKQVQQETMREADLEVFKKDLQLYQNGGSFKLQTWPIGTATLSDVEAVLDKEEYINQWVPDVVVIDSADNFRKDHKFKERRFQLGDIWEQISKLAKSRNLLVITASQGNRPSAKKDRLEQEDIAEDFSKIMTLDALFGINERGHRNNEKALKDKYWQRQQIECLASRYKAFIEGHQVMTLNNFALGQVLLDSEQCWYKNIGEIPNDI